MGNHLCYNNIINRGLARLIKSSYRELSRWGETGEVNEKNRRGKISQSFAAYAADNPVILCHKDFGMLKRRFPSPQKTFGSDRKSIPPRTHSVGCCIRERSACRPGWGWNVDLWQSEARRE
jgi:hypothetical protein